MPLLYMPVMQFTDADGAPLAAAVAHFFLQGTTTPSPVYEDVDLNVEIGTTVTADDTGLFVPIYFDGNVQLRMKLVVAGGDINDPLLDIDPVNETFSVGAAQIIDGAIAEALGYVPVDPDNAIFTSNARQNFDPASLNVDDIGYRGNRVNVKNVDYTLILDDSQKILVKDEATAGIGYTVPPNSDVGFPLGHYVWIYNFNAEVLTVIEGSGVTLNNNGIEGDFEIPPFTAVKLQQIESDYWSAIIPVPRQALTTNGYVVFPGGYIRQWGKVSSLVTNADTVTVDFPIEFPVGCLGAHAIPYNTAADAADDVWMQVVGTPSVTQAAFYAASSSSGTMTGLYWEAWGR